ncbi:MAG TPA: hypothetical protein VM933_08520, partial [Acidimicrobiales bacterium]|nr:hypothetical protein [Acidimicrobiales bacterium]
AGPTAARWAALSGAVCAVVLAREAGRSKDLGIAALAGLSLASGAATSWAAASPSLEMWMLALPSAFVVVEVAAMLSERDPFWHRAGRALGFGAELLALLALPLSLLIVLAAPIVEHGVDVFSDAPAWKPEPAAAIAWTLTATGWFLAAWRRRSPQPTLARAVAAAAVDDRTSAFLASALAAGVVVGTASTIAISVTFLVGAAALLAGRRVVAALAAVGLAAWAPVVVGGQPAVTLPVGLAAAAVLVAIGGRAWKGWPAPVFTAVGMLVLTGTSAIAVDHHGLTAGLLAMVFGGWVAAAAIESHDELAGFVARAPMVLGALSALEGTEIDALPVIAAAVLLFVVDAIRTDDPRLGFGAAGLLPPLVLVLAGSVGGTPADAGLAMAVTAAALTGLAVLTPERWQRPVAAAAGWSLAVGALASVGEGRRFATVLLLAGGVAITVGVAHRLPLVGHAGGALATVGLGLHLSLEGVTAIEAFLAPVALQLAVLGWQQRRSTEGLSSWVAYGPSMGILAVPALAERLDGGPAWHALVAGAVGVAGVALGGWRRLAGPLFLGTGLVVGVTFLESLHTLAGVPTWGWLAAGGTMLLGTGIALERADASPVEAGRRLVDVVTDRFE